MAIDLSVTKQINIGWREWVELPDLGIKKIKAKIDTGARTSVLHAENCELKTIDGKDYVQFTLIYGSRKNPKEKQCLAEIIEQRKVTDSGGHSQSRFVISTRLRVGDVIRKIEITLTSRKGMKFRMLLGRTAVSEGFLIDATDSYLT